MKRVTVTKEIKDRVNARLRECIELAEKNFNMKFPFPEVKYIPRGTGGGYAEPWKWTVAFNSILLMENVDEFIHRTVAHEMAHLVDYKAHPERFKHPGYTRTRDGRLKRKPLPVHGYTWKAIMMLFGAPPTRCHSYDVSNSKVKKRTRRKHEWVCGCGEGKMMLGAKRHKKQLNGTGGYYLRGHSPRTCGAYTYRGVEGAAPEPMLRAADAPGKASPGRPAPRHRKPRTGTKLDKCKKLYLKYHGCSRADIIEEFVNKAGCTAAGAATYYAKLKKEFG